MQSLALPSLSNRTPRTQMGKKEGLNVNNYKERALAFIDTLQDRHVLTIRETGLLRRAILENDPKKEEWIPVIERLPADLEPVNITWINHEPEPYYKDIKGKPFTATGVYFNGQWYWWSTLCTDILAEYSHNYDDIIDKAIEVIAWQPLPKPYKEGGEA